MAVLKRPLLLIQEVWLKRDPSASKRPQDVLLIFTLTYYLELSPRVEDLYLHVSAMIVRIGSWTLLKTYVNFLRKGLNLKPSGEKEEKENKNKKEKKQKADWDLLKPLKKKS